MESTTKDRLKDRTIWVRTLYALFFLIAYGVAETVLYLVVIFQYIAAMFTGKVNEALHEFSANLSRYIYQVLQFFTFNAETLPFPFSDWPDQAPGMESPWVSSRQNDAAAQESEPAPTDSAAQGPSATASAASTETDVDADSGVQADSQSSDSDTDKG